VVADPTLLDVDHTHNNGHQIRRTRTGRRQHGAHPSRYLRELRANPTDHGLRLRCANCHRSVTVQRREQAVIQTPL